MFTSATKTGQDIQAGETAIREGFTLAGLVPDNCAAIRIFDANKIANWVNQHSNVAVWLHEITLARSLGGLQSLTQWSKSPTISHSMWVDDDKSARFAFQWVENRPKLTPKNEDTVLTFEDAANKVALHLDSAQSILRVAGPSGFGKTRFVHNLFASAVGLAGTINANAIIYADNDGPSRPCACRRPERVVERDGEMWFVAADVCRALGYEEPHKAVARHCKKTNNFRLDWMSPHATPAKIIPAPDVYRLTLRSNLASAERFQDWVCEDILPSIAKHGAYMTPETIEDILSSPDTIIRLATDLKAEREQRALAETKALALGNVTEAFRALADDERDGFRITDSIGGR